MSTMTTKWIGRREVEQMLRDAGMPHSRPSIERWMRDPEVGFPKCRQLGRGATRLWDRESVREFIARIACSEESPEGAAA